MISKRLPAQIFSAEQCRALDRSATERLNLTGYQLMQRAAQAALALIRQHWPAFRSLSIWAGSGNNGGDGLVLARLAYELDWQVQLVVPDAQYASRLKGEASEAWRDLPSALTVQIFHNDLKIEGALIVDALLGIGFSGSLRAPYDAMVSAINRSERPVFALDLPSGLDSDSGVRGDEPVKADVTLTFIANKLGWLVGAGPDYAGQRFWAGLGVDPVMYSEVGPALAQLTVDEDLPVLLPRRKRSAHKGDFGVVLVLGGNLGMGGAAILAAEAALRVGAGRVILATRDQHRTASLSRIPELMVHGVETLEMLEPLIEQADLILVGPGLGQDHWARSLAARALSSDKPKLVDADALNLLAQGSITVNEPFIFTPHVGEAARLLDISPQEVGRDPLCAARLLFERYGGVQLLKGAGTLVVSNAGVAVSDRGNPGMATAGMGDLLSGIISGLWAQGLGAFDAARLGVFVHGAAGDRAAQRGERGMIASDLFAELRPLINGVTSTEVG